MLSKSLCSIAVGVISKAALRLQKPPRLMQGEWWQDICRDAQKEKPPDPLPIPLMRIIPL